ncbi:hypothetical protein CHELA1G11_11131 [Hyphomicrobiales bacterium]|nr:hypothetical protein CHELA1G11_11131 [Hyphomicrobiales bacterium]CAH1669920.1 hypothetical protein CHELA1G2_13179 [Hyphomicrobiales bacterium]
MLAAAGDPHHPHPRYARSVPHYAGRLRLRGFSVAGVYGSLVGSWPLIVANLVTLLLMLVIISMKLRFR